MNSIQCELIHFNSENKEIKISWIPDKFAIKNKCIIIDNKKWIVNKVYGSMLYDEVNKRSQDYKYQRKVSDI